MNSKKIKRILAFILCTVLMLSQIVMALADDGEGADPNHSDTTQEASITPEATPEVTPEATPEVIITPEATPEPTPEAIPKLTSEVIPEATPSTTPEPTPEVTPEITPETTPVDPSTVDVETAEDWESTIPALANVYAEDLVAVAKSQLGYTQSRVNVTTDDNGTVTGAYSRYGAWNATPYVQWDNLFIKFCLNYANIPAEKFPQADSAAEWVDILSGENYDLYVPATVSVDEYTPYAGDLIFFDTDEAEGADKVGIISAVAESTYQVIQKKDGAVSEVIYEKTDGRIVGYGMMPINMVDEGTTYEGENTDISSEEDGEIVTATAITIDQDDTLIGYIGTSQQLTVTFAPEDATAETLKWTSSDESIATVATDGTVSFIKTGMVTITATTENGLSDSIGVTVKILCNHDSECTMAASAMPILHQSTVNSETDEPSIVVNKTVSATDDPNEFELMLEAYTTGEKITVPMDIVLVLDRSGSMIQSQYYLSVDEPVKGYTYYDHDYYNQYRLDGSINPDWKKNYGLKFNANSGSAGYASPIRWCDACRAWIKSVTDPVSGTVTGYEIVEPEKTRLFENNMQATERSVRGFLNAIIDHGNQTGAKHRIAFAYYGKSTSGMYVNTAHYVNKNGVFDNTDTYQKVYMNVSDTSSINNALKQYANVGGIYSANTPTHLGVKQAASAIQYKSTVAGENISRQDMVVLFADGAPGVGTSINASWMADAKTYATDIKNNNIPIFTIGFYDNASADPSDMGDSGFYPRSNKFFSEVASPDSFIPAKGSAALSEAFKKIADNFSAQTLEYDAATIMREEISKYFVLDCDCEGTHNCGITVKTAECTGVDEEGNYTFATPVTAADIVIETAKTSEIPTTDIINVTGFSYKDNSVMETKSSTGTTYEGKKLILTVPIETREGFWGGNNVPTNDSSTALYHPKEGVTDYSPTEEGISKLMEIMKFPMPEANVPMTVDIGATDKTIYYGGAVTGADLFSGITAGYSEDAEGNWITPTTPVTVNADGTLTPQESWMDDYANLTWESNSTTPSTVIKNKECDDYGYEVVMTARAAARDNQSGHPGVNEAGGAIAGEAAALNTALSTRSEIANVHILVPVVTFEDSVINFGFKPDHNYYEDTNRVTEDDKVEWVEMNSHTDYPAVDETTKPELTYEYTPRTDNFVADTPVHVSVTSSNVDGVPGDITAITTFKWVPCTETGYHDSPGEDITTPHKGDVDSYEFWIHLEEPYELPSTGGTGIYWYMISGMVLMMGVPLILYKKRCKEVLNRR